MADVLNAVFYSFWTFAGTAILLWIVSRAIVAVVALLVVGGRANG